MDEAGGAVIRAALELRNSGYDGPFIGEVCEPLFMALAAYENARKAEPEPDLEQAERYIAALEEYIQRQNTCVVCECCLHPPGMPPYDSPPHCEDGCHPDWEEDRVIAWQENYLDDPVKQLRAKHGRAA